MSLQQFLFNKGFNNFEGYCQQLPNQVYDLKRLTSNSNINMMEIGFNAGHSADIFLQNKDLKLTSFDLGEHKYVSYAKEYIDSTYPDRHTLILGDSTVTVPLYIKDNKDVKFDIIFIDGGHEYNIVKNDMENCMKLAHSDTIVILDDTMFIKEWTEVYTLGPTKIWDEYLEQNKINEINRFHYYVGRGMVYGKYIF
jgi:hypothetical protein